MNCPHCGADTVDNEKYCPNCGNILSEKEGLFSDDVMDNRSIAILSYLGPLAFIPYFAAKRSPFARYHSLRGLNLFILEGIYSIASSIIISIARNILIVFGVLTSIASYAGWAFLIFVSIRGIMNVCQGKKTELPYLEFIRKYRIIKK